jgi:HK97 family phage portal protein
MSGDSMGIFDRLPWRARRSNPPLPQHGISGVATSALSFSELRKNPTVVACTNIISNAVAILPLNLYFKDPKTGIRKKAAWHPLYVLLRRRPNPSESPTLFFSKILRHILQKGNAYIFVNRRTSDGQIISVHLLNPESVTEKYEGMSVSYKYSGTEYTPRDILHIPSLVTDDHGKGFAPADIVRAAVLLGIQLDEYSLSSFGNGLNTKLLIDISEMTADLKDEASAQKLAQTVADYVRRNYTGAENAGKPLITWTGMKATELKNQSSNRDAELLESRRYQETEICKGFGVPPWMVNGTYDVKYGGLEQAMTVFANFTLGPYLRHIEQRFLSLMTAYEQEAYYFEFDLHVLLRADEKSRGEFYSKLFSMGAISPGEVCAKENLEQPDEGANARFVPANLMPLRNDVLDAYMASAKLKAAELVAGKSTGDVKDPAAAVGDQAL